MSTPKEGDSKQSSLKEPPAATAGQKRTSADMGDDAIVPTTLHTSTTTTTTVTSAAMVRLRRQKLAEENDAANIQTFVSIASGNVNNEDDTTADDNNGKNDSNNNNNYVTRKSMHIVSTIQTDLEQIRKTLDNTEIEMITHIKELEANKAYYSKRTSRRGNTQRKAILLQLQDGEEDDVLGCRETLAPLTDAAAKQQQQRQQRTTAETHRRIIQAAQETMIIRETARRLRKQARELCQRRVRSKNIANQAF